MCTRFTFNTKTDSISGFNFDVDPNVWQCKLIMNDIMFCIALKYKGRYMPIHGVNANGNVSAMLYTPEIEAGKYRRSPSCYRIDILSERVIRGELSFDDAVEIVKTKHIVNVPTCSLQEMQTDKTGRVLLIEPGTGYRLERERYSLMTNYSVLAPETSAPFILEGDDRYERAKAMLDARTDNFGVKDAFNVLSEVSQTGIWATRVSFVYSASENAVYYVKDNAFDDVSKHAFKHRGAQ